MKQTVCALCDRTHIFIRARELHAQTTKQRILCKLWVSHSGADKDTGIWHCAIGRVVPSISQDCNAFTFRTKQSKQTQLPTYETPGVLPKNTTLHSWRLESSWDTLYFTENAVAYQHASLVHFIILHIIRWPMKYMTSFSNKAWPCPKLPQFIIH